MVMCVSSMALCTLGNPHHYLNSNITFSIFGCMGHVINFLNMMFIALSTSQRTSPIVDLPIASYSIGLNHEKVYK